jgi:hypothetical protein
MGLTMCDIFLSTVLTFMGNFNGRLFFNDLSFRADTGNMETATDPTGRPLLDQNENAMEKG